MGETSERFQDGILEGAALEQWKTSIRQKIEELEQKVDLVSPENKALFGRFLNAVKFNIEDGFELNEADKTQAESFLKAAEALVSNQIPEEIIDIILES